MAIVEQTEAPMTYVALRRADITVTLPDGQVGIQVGYVVTVGGYVHGGRTSHDEALAHRDRCEAWTEDERLDFVARCQAAAMRTADCNAYLAEVAS